LDEANLSKRHSLDAIEAWRARKYSLTFTQLHEDDKLPLMSPEVEQESPVDKSESSDDLAANPAVDGTSKVETEEMTKTQEEDLTLDEEEGDEVSLSATYRAADSSTIVGDDLTFADDDTAVATIATVLGRGRHRKPISKIVEEESISTKGESLRVSFDVGSKNHATTGRERKVLPTLTGRHSSSTAVKNAPDSKSMQSPVQAEQQAADITIMGCNETLIDDETVAKADVTVVGRGRQRGKVQRQAIASVKSPGPEASSKRDMDLDSSTSPGEHTVKEIIVDTSASSCSMDHADSSTDVSVLDSTIASPRSFVKESEDETTVGSLLVTPVLDRYRLEADDTSIGVRVVPNPRGAHHGVPNQKQKNLLTKYGAAPRSILQTTRPSAANTTKDDPLPTTSPFVTQRTHTVYRKTPHPKKASFVQPADENTTPNLDGHTPLKPARLDTGTQIKSDSLRSPFTRVTLPELTQRPYRKSLPSTARRLPFSATKAQPERRHTISFKQQASMSRTPLTAAWIAKHMPEDSSLVNSLDVSSSFMSND